MTSSAHQKRSITINSIFLSREAVSAGTQIDPGLAALLGVIITSVVALIGHRVAISKGKTEKDAAVHAGFDKLTSSLQNQITEMKADIAELKKQLQDTQDRNTELVVTNEALKHELSTKEELINGVEMWLDLWEDWLESGSEPPPPSYTWQMRRFMRRAREARQILEGREEEP